MSNLIEKQTQDTEKKKEDKTQIHSGGLNSRIVDELSDMVNAVIGET